MNPVIGNALLTAAPLLPIALVAGWLLPPLRRRMSVLLVIAPLPALAASLLANGASVTFWRGLVPITLALDTPGALLLGVCSLLWIAAAVYAAVEWRGTPTGCQFAVCWLLTLTGSIGVFIASDLASFFLAYTLVSIPAYGLIVHDDTPPVCRAGAVYIAFAVLGETMLLMAFALLAAATPNDSLSIHDVLAALSHSPWRGATLALLILGFGMKIALVPLHVWMPLTYRAAPIPAAAVLSGAGVKAGVIGLIRFLPFGDALPDPGIILAAVGLFGAFYGVAIGLTKSDPKIVLAYSSISQMGVIAAVLGMALAGDSPTARMATAFYAAHHVLVKGGLFLAVGLAASMTRRTWIVLVPAFVLALSLGGLPLTGGFLAKLAIKPQLGYGLVATLNDLSAAATTMLMLHFLRRLTATSTQGETKSAPLGHLIPWLVMVIAAIAVPWALYPLVGSTRIAALTPAVLWGSLWPVLLGAVLSLPLFGLRDRAPRAPDNDGAQTGDTFLRVVTSCGAVLERMEGEVRQWSAASLSLVLAAALLGFAMLLVR